MVAPVRWCWCSRPVVSAFNYKAAPPAAGVRLVVPEASAEMTVLLSSGCGRRHGWLVGKHGCVPPVPGWPTACWRPVGVCG